MANRSEASKKGWETRRAKAALAAKRSEAAKKGWETRRARRAETVEIALKPKTSRSAKALSEKIKQEATPRYIKLAYNSTKEAFEKMQRGEFTKEELDMLSPEDLRKIQSRAFKNLINEAAKARYAKERLAMFEEKSPRRIQPSFGEIAHKALEKRTYVDKATGTVFEDYTSVAKGLQKDLKSEFPLRPQDERDIAELSKRIGYSKQTAFNALDLYKMQNEVETRLAENSYREIGLNEQMTRNAIAYLEKLKTKVVSKLSTKYRLESYALLDYKKILEDYQMKLESSSYILFTEATIDNLINELESYDRQTADFLIEYLNKQIERFGGDRVADAINQATYIDDIYTIIFDSDQSDEGNVARAWANIARAINPNITTRELNRIVKAGLASTEDYFDNE